VFDDKATLSINWCLQTHKGGGGGIWGRKIGGKLKK